MEEKRQESNKWQYCAVYGLTEYVAIQVCHLDFSSRENLKRGGHLGDSL